MARPALPLWVLLPLAIGILAGCRLTPERVPDDVLVHVGSVAVDVHNFPVVILEEQQGSRKLPIWIGPSEARSIATEMENVEAPRPNTHDLAKRLIEGLRGEVVRVVVTELRERTYFASLSIRVDGEVVEIDSRPSDAIAIALRTGAPIFVRAPLFDTAGDDLGGDEEGRPI